ncbi:hypothetical protein A2Z22_03145 [Candidatus Woesebacteria bacterium RBG_16_34_12]|uniref:Dockerin domain-containing protein n=1 Tax=Candidatus Woesebacteria bacterium RBG_16_34_12 TaxID=1802480 RepID=A0A1F7XCM6_9BACT|nr:MAG: hypothetical protein A2Z22_03145 [Candidatus Woesebacteria bacterium RBG_16_34_12]
MTKHYFKVTILLMVLILNLIFTSTIQAQISLLNINPNPPSQTQKLVFLHASVGQAWLNYFLGGKTGQAYWDISLGGNNYNVRDYLVGFTGGGSHPNPELIGHGLCDLYNLFTNPTNLQVLFNHNQTESPLGVNDPSYYTPLNLNDASENDIVVIKPCYIDYPYVGNPDDPPTGLHGCPFYQLEPGNWQNKTVGNVKQVLIDIVDVFRQHPDKFFVIVTAPPLRISDPATINYGQNARAMADWMMNEWLQTYYPEGNNVMVYDLFNVLTSNANGEGSDCQIRIDYNHPELDSDVLLDIGNHHRIWNSQIQHQQQYDQNYTAYCCLNAQGWCDTHPPRYANYKMTKEFVPILNTYVNAWLAGQETTPSPSITTAPTSLPTSSPTPPPALGDANSDGVVDGIDYVIWLNHYNQPTSNRQSDGDFNSDGRTDGIDYVIWLNNYSS